MFCERLDELGIGGEEGVGEEEEDGESEGKDGTRKGTRTSLPYARTVQPIPFSPSRSRVGARKGGGSEERVLSPVVGTYADALFYLPSPQTPTPTLRHALNTNINKRPQPRRAQAPAQAEVAVEGAQGRGGRAEDDVSGEWGSFVCCVGRKRGEGEGEGVKRWGDDAEGKGGWGGGWGGGG